MKQLWAPWRMELIAAEKTKPPGCIFCDFPAQSGAEADKNNLILGRSERSFAMLNKYPYNSGHLMVIPRRHTADFPGLEPAELADLHQLLRLGVELVQQAYQPQGVNVGMNLGRCAGAGIADHLHYHVVPRWEGDTNFMPVLADTKVIIEHLLEAYDRLRPRFDARLA